MSLVSHLQKGTAIDRDTLYWHYARYHKTKPYSVIRNGSWKLIRFHEEGEPELYHLNKDPSESSDMSGQFNEKAKILEVQLDNLLESVDAQHMTADHAHDRDRERRGRIKRKGRRKRSSEEFALFAID